MSSESNPNVKPKPDYSETILVEGPERIVAMVATSPQYSNGELPLEDFKSKYLPVFYQLATTLKFTK